jgi:hypothetical protein
MGGLFTLPSNKKGKNMLFEQMTDVVPSIFAWLNQGPLTLTIALHTFIILPMFWIYASEKKRLNK